MEELKRQGIYEDTIIFYTSDHGSHFCTRNSEYKRSCHDDSIHVPFLARGGIFNGGRVITELTSLIDIAPTLLYAAGIPKPEEMRGVPMQRLIEHPGEPIHPEVFIQISESCIGRALRTPEWTYCVEAPISSREETCLPNAPVYVEKYLYHLPSDPYQRHNLCGDPAYREVCDSLRETLLSYIAKEEGLHPEIRES